MSNFSVQSFGFPAVVVAAAATVVNATKALIENPSRSTTTFLSFVKKPRKQSFAVAHFDFRKPGAASLTRTAIVLPSNAGDS